MAAIGPELKQTREKRGVSLMEISATTKVGRRYLEALEQDRLDLFPGQFFAKGIIRTYAKAIGLDDQEVVQRYMKAGLLGEAEPPRAISLPPPPGPKWRVLFAGLAVIVVGGLTFGLYSLLKPAKPASRSVPPSASATASSVVPDTTPVVPAAVPEPQSAAPGAVPVPPPDRGLAFAFAVTAPTWLQIYADGQLMVDGIKLAGARFEVRAEKELVLHLGNAAGLTAALGGKPLKPFGRSGAVVKNIRVTAENAADFLEPGPAKGN